LASAADSPLPAQDFSTLFDFLPIGAYRSSPDGAQMRANPALVRLNGYASEAEMLSRVRDIAVEWYVDPDRRQRFREQLERDGQVQGFVSEIYRHKTRERIWVSENAHVVRDPEGRVRFYEGTVEEITSRIAAETALRRSEELLREVTARVPGFMYRLQINPDGTRRYSFASDGVRALYGVEPSAVLADATLLHRFRHPEDRARIAAEFEAAMRAGLPLSSEFRIVLADGTVKWVQMLSSPTPSDEAQNVRTGMMVDVTARKQAEALRIERDRAESANLAKTQFLSRVSHELRTPLNAILGFAQLLDLDASARPKQREWVVQILNSGRHLLGLVDDVLDLSSAQTGLLEFDRTEVDLQAVVHESWTMLAAAAAAASVQFVDALRPALPHVQADRKRLKQVISNLLSNAVKYNQSGGRITVEAGADDATVRLFVRDTGRGMNADQLERIFKPFERLGAHRSGVDGTGLGLALVKQFMEAMGGSIQVESRAGSGSTFTVTLPRARPGLTDART
jgi:PAS domain S-box-containing protein